MAPAAFLLWQRSAFLGSFIPLYFGFDWLDFLMLPSSSYTSDWGVDCGSVFGSDWLAVYSLVAVHMLMFQRSVAVSTCVQGNQATSTPPSRSPTSIHTRWSMCLWTWSRLHWPGGPLFRPEEHR
jgi:hypothetical protein